MPVFLMLPAWVKCDGYISRSSKSDLAIKIAKDLTIQTRWLKPEAFNFLILH